MENKEMLLYGALLVAVLLAAFTAYNLLAPQQPAPAQTIQNTQQNYQAALASELPDKCKAPPGYTDESWREHMGHHPDRYAECLNK